MTATALVQWCSVRQLFLLFMILMGSMKISNAAQDLNNNEKAYLADLMHTLQSRNIASNFFAQFSNNASMQNTETGRDDDQNVNYECALQLNDLSNGISKRSLWALQFLDAWGKIPAGILYGHLIEMGHYDECVQINADIINETTTATTHIDGKYCLADVPLGQLLNMESLNAMNLKIGVCLPAACHADQMDSWIKQLLAGLLQTNITTDLQLIDEKSCSVRKAAPFSGAAILTMVILGILGCLMAIGTFSDYAATQFSMRLHTFLLAFSIRANLRQLLRIVEYKNAPHVIPCLHGIRCLSLMWVIIGHGFMYLALSPNMNPVDLIDTFQKPFGMILQSGVFAVDTFFFLSGLLLVMIAMRAMEKTSGKLNVPLMYLHRYLRLTPVVALAILVYLTLAPYFGSGPVWSTGAFDICKETWWSTLLYVQNYATPNKMCLGHTWYLAVDMQLFIISPIFLIALWRWGKKAIVGIIIVVLLLFACLFSLIIINNYTIFFRNLVTDRKISMKQIYYSTHTRASPWLIGIVFGYYLHLTKGRRITFTLPTLTVITGWTCSLTVIFAIIFGLYSQAQFDRPTITTLEEAFFVSLSRIGWPLALCWIVFACINNYGGAANEFLSCPSWQPLSRLSYCMYIWHMMIEQVNAMRVKTNTYFSVYDLMLRFWSDFCITILLSVAMYLAIEAPMASIENILLPKQPIRRTPSTVPVVVDDREISHSETVAAPSE